MPGSVSSSSPLTIPCQEAARASEGRSHSGSSIPSRTCGNDSVPLGPGGSQAGSGTRLHTPGQVPTAQEDGARQMWQGPSPRTSRWSSTRVSKPRQT